ncbi:MAG: RNA-binding S4 domain-containing protein [Burkholderiales bacterium]|nr:RNA-binding S4 domain-containing protein [Burkholderiales bacterium]
MSVALRIDKWLWAARFFRTRSAAQQAVEGGKVKLNGERVKPSKEVRVADELAIHIGAYEWIVRVEGLSDKRGAAPVARMLWSEDEAGRLKREEQAALRKFAAEPAQERHCRPTKRERRQLERWREG